MDGDMVLRLKLPHLTESEHSIDAATVSGEPRRKTRSHQWAYSLCILTIYCAGALLPRLRQHF